MAWPATFHCMHPSLVCGVVWCGDTNCVALACSALATSPSETLAEVQNYYGKVLATSKDLKTNACTTSDAPPQIIRQALARVPQPIKDKSVHQLARISSPTTCSSLGARMCVCM
jgi:hypothetical protein